MRDYIKNPKELSNRFRNYAELYNFILKQNVLEKNQTEIYLKFVEQNGFAYCENVNDSVKYTEVKYHIEIDWLKARVFDESKSLPYKMELEEMRQAFPVSSYAKQMMGFNELGDWLIKIAESERERIMNEKRLEHL